MNHKNNKKYQQLISKLSEIFQNKPAWLQRMFLVERV